MIVAAFVAALVACGSGASVAKVDAPADATAPPAFVNDEGKLACPVMGDVVVSPERSAGHVDYDGKRYYFCCNSCDQLFNEDPEKYADGRHLREIGKLRGGTSDAPACELPPATATAAPAG